MHKGKLLILLSKKDIEKNSWNFVYILSYTVVQNYFHFDEIFWETKVDFPLQLRLKPKLKKAKPPRLWKKIKKAKLWMKWTTFQWSARNAAFKRRPSKASKCISNFYICARESFYVVAANLVPTWWTLLILTTKLSIPNVSPKIRILKSEAMKNSILVMNSGRNPGTFRHLPKEKP